MNLSHLTDKALLEDIRNLALKERHLVVEVLYHLAEVDRRRLYSDLKQASLYDYCINELKYSEGSAQRKIVSARLLNEIPEIAQKITQGTLTLMNISLAVKFMKDHNIKESTGKRKIIEQIQNLSKKECENKLFEILGKQRPQVTTITIMNDTFSILQTTREMLGGYLSNDQLITKIAEDEIKKIEKERFKQTGSKGSPPPVEVKRVISAETKRSKYAESQCCENCGSITDLEYDHIIPFALGGTNDPENIRILCRNCNERSRIEARL
jgi:hypothetical protein